MKAKSTEASGPAPRTGAQPTAPPRIRKLLATTDFSDHSLAGVRYAVSLGESLGAEVELVFVLEPPPRLAGIEAVAFARPDAEVEISTREHLERLARKESRGPRLMTSSVRTGTPFHEITALARVRKADMIVIATHGHTGAKHLLLGSTAERVVRHAPCPVLTVPAHVPRTTGTKATALKVGRILVPIDFSAVSRAALPNAILLAQHFRAEVTLVHVIERLPIDAVLGLGKSANTLRALARQAAGKMEAMASDLGHSTGLKVSAAVRDGTPFQVICTVAKESRTDLVVLTTRGQTGLSHVVLGSTAERVVRHAPCPVLAVRTPARNRP